MELQNKQEAPATLSEAWSHGIHAGQELNLAKRNMRRIIAERLHKCRMDAKLTQQELGIKVDINHLTYRGYENCKSDIPVVYLIRIADFYGVTLDYLTGRTDSKEGIPEQKMSSSDTDARIDQLEKMVAQLHQSLAKK